MNQRSGGGFVPPWRHARQRGLLIQAAVAVVVVAAVALAYAQVASSIEARRLSTGFDFLAHRGGFQIAPALIAFSEASSFGRAFLVGLLNTLLVGALAIPLATAIGIGVAAARLGGGRALARAAFLYVETVRNIPPLIQLFFWYFVALRTLPAPRQSWTFLGAVLNNRGLQLPVPLTDSLGLWLVAGACVGLIAAAILRVGRFAAFGFGLAGAALALALAAAFGGVEQPVLRGFNYVGGILLTPELVALTLTLAVYQAAYVAETVRSGIETVPRGQSEAAQSLGLRPGPTWRLVVFPQALVSMLPPLATTYVSIVKASTLAAAIAYPDLVAVFAGTVLNLTGQAIEIMLITGSVYLAISFGIAGLISLFENRLAWRRR